VASSASDAAKYQTVIALRKYAGQVSGDGVGGHHTARPRRIPDKENGEAAEHKPVRDFGSAGLDEKLCNASGIAVNELLLTESSKPRRTIGEQVFPSPNGEPIPIQTPISFPRARDGDPCVACEDVRRDAESD